MLTERMTFEEMYREMKADEFELKCKMLTDYRANQLRRASMKNKDCTVSNHFFVNTSRRNRYACIIEVNGWKDFCHERIHQYWIAIYDTDGGKYAAMIGKAGDYGMERSMVGRYQPHFFKRYAERMRLNLTGEALIMHYFVHNNIFCMKLNPLERNPDEAFVASREGLALGYAEGLNIKFNTFIPYKGLGKAKYEISQKELDYLQDLMTAKYGSFIKTEAQASFYTEHDMMIDIIERDMTDVGMRPSERHARTFSSSDYLNALFEFSMRKSAFEEKKRKEQQ